MKKFLFLENLLERCPVLVADGNLRGEQDYVAKAGEAKTIMVSLLLDIPLIKEGIFLQHHLTKGAVSHAHLEYSLQRTHHSCRKQWQQ
ncbi:MAG: hypothetical protein GY917_31140 [Planctomycetaceae bacterium]|nr:hypothetical protein [Planctomycetaceae bacterium]